MPDEQCFSVIFHSGSARLGKLAKKVERPLDLVADNRHVRDEWVKSIRDLVKSIESVNRRHQYEVSWAKQKWNTVTPL